MLEVIPLGIAAAVTPGLIALQVLVVSGPSWVKRAVAVFLANFLAFAIVAALLMLGLAQLPDAGTGLHGRWDTIIRLVGAAVLALITVFFLLPHPQLLAKSQAAFSRVEGKAHPWEFALLAFYFAITDISSFAVMAPALHDITVSDAALIWQGLFLAIFFILALVATWAPPALRVVMGDKAVRILNGIYAFVMARQFQIVAAICAVFTLYLLITGLRG